MAPPSAVPQQGTTTTEKYLPFQLSRVRFAPVFGPQLEPLVLTGSSQEEVNSVCVWQYDRYPGYATATAAHHPTSGEVDLEGALPCPLGDSADEPRLVVSAHHGGDVQQLRTHTPSRLVFTASSMGHVCIYSLGVPEVESDAFRLTEVAKWSPRLAGGGDGGVVTTTADVPVSDVAVSSDASQLYVGNDIGCLVVLDTELLIVKQQLKTVGLGYDVATINAIEAVDSNCVATANQIGQLNVWDLRSSNPSKLPQRRIVPTGEPRPLVSLSQHPGQSHLVAVGGVNNGGGGNDSTSTCYIWDLRAEQHPLSEITCRGSAIWELAFHPRQPQFLYLATEEAGLVRVQSAASLTDSWSFAQNCQKKLTMAVVGAYPSADSCSVTSFDLTSSGLIIAGRDNCTLQTIKDSSVSAFSCA